jgi:hypothetical protein
MPLIRGGNMGIVDGSFFLPNSNLSTLPVCVFILTPSSNIDKRCVTCAGSKMELFFRALLNIDAVEAKAIAFRSLYIDMCIFPPLLNNVT